jgi:Glu-tRNA(Gln) amidotransferase subunit E-like FAD-binding protein
MLKVDYKKLEMKSGLEIHQQLNTGKLFCNCPSVLRSDEPDYIIKRKLHAIAGESGEIDVAAKYEASLEKEFEYYVYDTNCLVELDEEPPHEINQDALKIVLQIALLLNCKIIPISQIMRKTVINGSNTSGFQRTVMVARDGYFETSFGRVRIAGIFLEEDSARPVKSEKNITTYKLDRLGIPLIEIATEPDIKTPEQAKESALKIGEILRSCNVKRGIGTIRQDINISIKGTNRVEIKGFQDPKIMIDCVEKELLRQKEFVDNKKVNSSEVRNCLPDGTTEFLRPMPGEARMYPETDLPLLKISRDFINSVKKDLPKLRSEIEKDLGAKGLDNEMIKLIFKYNQLKEFKELLNIVNNPKLVAKVLLLFPKEIASKEKLSLEEVMKKLEDVYGNIFLKIKKGKILENQIKDVLLKIIRGEDFNKAIKFEKIDIGDMEEKIMKIIRKKPGLSEKAYMGLVMKEFKGKIGGKDAIEIIKKHVI